MDNLPNELLSLLSSASIVEKRAMLIALSDNIQKSELTERKNDQKLTRYVDYFPSFVSDDVVVEGIQDELKSMNIGAANTRKVTTFWLNSTDDGYFYGGVNHAAHSFTNYPVIKNLMDILNDSEHVSNSSTLKLNSCLVTCYSTSKKSLSLHSDDEPHICQQSPICNVSLGKTRTSEFVPKVSNAKTLCSFDLEHCSLNLMKAGCQQQLKHRVVPAQHEPNSNNVRYSLSFRRFITDPSGHISPVKSNINLFENMVDGYQIEKTDIQSDSSPTESPKTKLVDTVLFAGDSHFKHLDSNKLGKGKINVVNISKGGDRICDTESAISNFYMNNTSFNIIKVFVSVQWAQTILDTVAEVCTI